MTVMFWKLLVLSEERLTPAFVQPHRSPQRSREGNELLSLLLAMSWVVMRPPQSILVLLRGEPEEYGA